jgi:hypothetical protein
MSQDGRYWTPPTNVTTEPATQILWDGLKWVVPRDTTLLYKYSEQSFSVVNIQNTALTAIETNGSIYVGIGNNGVYYSYDGINWQASASGSNIRSTLQKAKVLWNGRIWVICGDGDTYAIMYSYDGKEWTGVANSRTIFNISGGAVDVAWNGRIFVATGLCSNGYAISTSIDGVTWTNTMYNP